MSFPVTVHGPSESQVYSESLEKKMPYGTLLLLPDNRKYRYVLKSAAAAVAADMQQAAANTANHINRDVVTGGAVGDRTHALTLGATAATKDEYLDGWLLTELDPGSGYAYTIGPHAAVDSSGVFTIPFAPGVSLKVATTSTTDASLIHSPYVSVLINPTTATQVPVGVAKFPITTSYSSWVQSGGPSAVRTEGTLVLGDVCVISASAAGAVAPAADDIKPRVGRVMRVAPTTEASMVFLTID